MAEMEQIDLGDGYVLCVCAVHRLEICHHCGFDFEIMNEETRLQRGMELAAKRKMPPKLLPRGTMVRMKDRSGRHPPRDLVAEVRGAQMGDPHDFGDLVMCYVIVEKREGAERMLISTEEVHEEWFLEEVTLDMARQLLARVDGEENDEDEDSDGN